MPAVLDRPKKIRIPGTNRWVLPDADAAPEPVDPTPQREAFTRPAPSVQAQAVAELANIIAFDEDGNEIVAGGGEYLEYEDYLNATPNREDRRRFATPVHYWEVRWPGCTLQPYPRLGSFRSELSGVWRTEYPYQEQAVREHILLNVRCDPDLLKVSAEELAVMDGKPHATIKIRYCQDGGCHFVCCNPAAVDLHESITGHTTKAKPRED